MHYHCFLLASCLLLVACCLVVDLKVHEISFSLSLSLSFVGRVHDPITVEHIILLRDDKYNIFLVCT